MSIKRILNIINPQPQVGGLEISDSALRFVMVKGSKLGLNSLNLTAGTISEGKIRDKDNFKTAVKKLHSQIARRKGKKIYVILNIPDVNVYTQVFNLPMVAIENLEEAAHLNLQMISPSDFSSVYSDWQKVGENKTDGGQLEILGTFAANKAVDEFVECLKEANFVVAAIEFPSLAVSRLISGLEGSVKPLLLLYITSGGLSFGLIRNRNLYFNHFVPWPVSGERQISLSSIKEIIIRETQRILNFSGTHWPDTQISDLLLAAPALEEKISQIISENFPLSVQKINLPSKLVAPDSQWSVNNSQLTSLASDWFAALGSAVRGLIPRAKDIIISLASTGTEEEFRQHQLINFIKIWRNIILTSLSFILIAFAVVDLFLMRDANSLNGQLANLANLPELKEVNKLQEEAEEFNRNIELGLRAKNRIYDWSQFFGKIRELAGEAVTIERVFIQAKETPILLNGQAADEKTVIDFKNKLAQDPQFQNVDLPLSNIVSAADGSLKFTITFKLK